MEEYDTDGSGLLDTAAEVAQVPCLVWRTVRGTSGGALAPMGFGTRGDFYGDRIGIGPAVREEATRAMNACPGG